MHVADSHKLKLIFDAANLNERVEFEDIDLMIRASRLEA